MSLEKHFIQEGIIRSEVENYLKAELSQAGYSGINIQKTPLSTRVILYVEKPPLVIGKRGNRINTLTDYLKQKYKIENPTIDVQKIEVPTLDANIVARRIAVALERGINRRRVVYKALHAVMSSGARGIEVTLSGKIVGKGGRSRTEKYSEGYMKKAGESAKLVRVGSIQAALKAGVIGVTVKIVPPNTIFPDQIAVLEEACAKSEEVPKEAAKKEKKQAGKDAEEKPKKAGERKPRKKKTEESEEKPGVDAGAGQAPSPKEETTQNQGESA
jgi:small subunit ribosomal protein S3